MNKMQLRRTSGTVYGEIMGDSRISLLDGNYITGIDFVSGLINREVVSRRSTAPVLDDLWASPDYGRGDNQYTGIQLVKMGHKRITRNSQYTFNPWREIMGGDPVIADTYNIFNPLKNPRKIAEKLKALYGLFVGLPQRLQDDFMQELSDSPCDLEYTGALDPTQNQLRIYHEILGHVPDVKRPKVADVLKLMSAHNICVDKGDIIEHQVKHLMGFDTSTIPNRWSNGHLEEAVLTEERIRELKNLLQKKKIRTS